MASPGTTRSPEVRTEQAEPEPEPEAQLIARWAPRPILAAAVGVVWQLAHFGGALAVAVAVGHLLGTPTGWVSQLVHFVVLACVASASLEVTQRVFGRLISLRTLLRLSLAFPGAAPSRFAVSLRRGSTRQLARMLERRPSPAVPDRHDDAAVVMLELVAALSVHDLATRGHSERVRAYTELIGEELGLDRPACEALRWGGLIHDIGKLRVPATVLNKTGALTTDEWEIIRRHPQDGAELAAAMSPWLGEWASAVLDHHERWEGGGYPRDLSGSDISLAGRVVAVADAFDVMTSARSYKPPRRQDEARAELVRCSGTQFDPMVVRAFLNISIRRARRIIGPLAALAPWPILQWRLVKVARRVATPAAVVLIAGAATFATASAQPTHPATAGPGGAAAPAVGASDPGTAGSESTATAGTGSPTSTGDVSALSGLTPFAHLLPVGRGGGEMSEPPGGGRSGRGGDGPPGGPGGGGTDPAAPTTLTIDPAAGSIDLENLGPANSTVPLVELAPAGAVLCGQAGACDPISVTLPVG